MIPFRHHVVSLVAVLLALAAGVALGGGPLSDLGRTATPELRAENADLKAELKEATASDGTAESVLEQHGASLVSGTLKELRVAMLTLPEAPEEAVADLAQMVKQAGGQVVATYELLEKAYAPEDKSLVDTLGSQLAEDVEGVPAEATTYERLGQLIARVVVGAPDATTSLVSSLSSAGLLTVGDDAGAADLVIVVGADTTRQVETDALADLLGAVDSGVDGSVTVASEESGRDGLLAGLRSDEAWAAAASSVDSIDTTSGLITTVFALAADASGGPGHYGAFGADGATPRP